jgi:hypothetical protein
LEALDLRKCCVRLMLSSKKHSQREPHAISAGRDPQDTSVDRNRLVITALLGQDVGELAQSVYVSRLLKHPEPKSLFGSCGIACAQIRYSLSKRESRLCAAPVMAQGRR